MPRTKTPLHRVQSIAGYQSRASQPNPEIVKEYAERYSEGKPMEDIDVCGSHNMGFFVVDGFHRHAAMKLAGFQMTREITVNVVDARIDPSVVKWIAAGANTAHGVRRTNEDKKRAVEMALESHPEQSDGAIADHVGVSAEMVRKLRPQVPTVGTSSKRIGKDGKQYPAPPPPPPKPVQQKEPPMAPEASPKAAEGEGQPSTPPEAPKAQSGNQKSETQKRDELNRPIPEDLQEHWNRRGELMSHISKLKEVQRALVNGRQERDPLYAQVTQETVAYSTNIINALEDSLPYAVCPWCGGMNPGCKMCGNRGGMVSKFQIERFAKPDPEVWKRVMPVAVEAET